MLCGPRDSKSRKRIHVEQPQKIRSQKANVEEDRMKFNPTAPKA
jgi:hypothetical protein